MNSLLTKVRSLSAGVVAVVVGLFTPATVPAQTSTPTFQDNFVGGNFDPSLWTVATGPAAGSGVYLAQNVDSSEGHLRLKLSQRREGAVLISEGSEIMSKGLYGYGTYTYVMRMSSTAASHKLSGKSVSGSVSAGWNYLPGSETEIDFEFRADKPNGVQVGCFTNRDPSRQETRIHISSMSRDSNLEQSFHTYTFIWTPKSIVWYVDGKKSWQTNSNVPTKPAQIRINHWGIDNPKFGGPATVNVDRYMYVKSVSFAPLAGK